MRKLILTAFLAPLIAFGQYSPVDSLKSAENRLLTIESSLYKYREDRNQGLVLMFAGAGAATLGYFVNRDGRNLGPSRLFFIFGSAFTLTGTVQVLRSTRHFKKFEP